MHFVGGNLQIVGTGINEGIKNKYKITKFHGIFLLSKVILASLDESEKRRNNHSRFLSTNKITLDQGIF